MSDKPGTPRAGEVGAVSFWVPGIPKAMSVGRTIRAGANTFQARRNTEWATLVGYHGRQVAPRRPFEGPVDVRFTFNLPRPKSAKRGAMYPLKRPDLDNLFHKLTDQWNGVFWADDSQIVSVSIQKCYASSGPGLAVEIVALAELTPAHAGHNSSATETA